MKTNSKIVFFARLRANIALKNSKSGYNERVRQSCKKRLEILVPRKTKTLLDGSAKT